MILRRLVNVFEKHLPTVVQYYGKVLLRRVRLMNRTLYSSEVSYIKYLLEKILDESNKYYFVDIGASDGILNSNTYDLAINKWFGISIEGNATKYKVLNKTLTGTNVKPINQFIYSPNITEILKNSGCQRVFDFLSLDIDSFEYSVLNKILIDFQPRLICVEINERFPPPLVFYVEESADSSCLKDAFYGMSLQAAYEVFKRHDYKIIGLHYNNVYAVPSSTNIEEMDTVKCYKDGYLNAQFRERYFYWNKPYNFLLELSPYQILNFFDQEFAALKAYYRLYIKNSNNPS